jgi:hypothetical protein
MKHVSRLSSKQSEVWAMLEESREVEEILYGGAAGGGKSWLGCAWQIYRRCRYPNTRGLIGRSQLKNLRLTTLKTFFDFWQKFGKFNPAGVTFTFNQQENVIYFSNGSEIFLKDLFQYPSDPDFTSHGSMEITDAFLDEATEITEKAFMIVQSRMRYNLGAVGGTPKILLTANPAENWVKYRYVLSRENKSLDPESSRQFVAALVDDNPDETFKELYRKQLRKLSDYDQKRLLFGDWTALVRTGGEFYTGFSRAHNAGDVDFNPELPAHLSFDQNVTPYITLTCWQVEEKEGVTWLKQFDEFCLPNPDNTTERLCRAFSNKYGDRLRSVFIYGDPSGKKRDTRGKDVNDYTIAKRELRRWLNNGSDRVASVAPPVLKRRDFLNNCFSGNYEKIRILIDQTRCLKTLQDLTQLKQDPNGHKLKEKERDPLTGATYEKFGHCSDSFDYIATTIFRKDFERFCKSY